MSRIFKALQLSREAMPESVMRALENGRTVPPPALAASAGVSRDSPKSDGFEQRRTASPQPAEAAGNGILKPDGSGSVEQSAVPHPDALDECNLTEVRQLSVRLGDMALLLSPPEGQSYAAEQYRIARTKIIQRLNKPFRLVVSSPGSGDGKTLTSLNLAAALAMTCEGRTLLIDADLRRANIHRRLEVPPQPGLAEVLAGKYRLHEAMFRVRQLASLYVLPAGKPEGNPTEMLASSHWRALAETVRQQFAHVIVDSPPVDIVADYDLIESACDGVLLVVRPNHTDRTLCRSALAKARPKLTGVLVNVAEEWFLWKRPLHRYYHYYGNNENRQPRGEDKHV